MRAHVIEGGVVVNTIEVDSLAVLPNLIAATEGSIGWLWDGSTLTPPSINLPAVKSTAWEQIKASRDQRKDGGALVNGKWFHTDIDSRIQQLALVLMGATVPAVQWKTMDGTFVTMSQTLAGQIFAAVAALDMAIFATAETHRTAMEASATPATYDFSTGWPAHYPI